jgi:hypothetical protein
VTECLRDRETLECPEEAGTVADIAQYMDRFLLVDRLCVRAGMPQETGEMVRWIRTPVAEEQFKLATASFPAP